MKDDNETELTEGDLIEFDRKLYKHWGVYCGYDEVIHVNGDPYLILKSSKLSFSNTKEAEIIKQKVKDVAGEGKFYKNNLHDVSKTSFSSSEILKRAKKCLGKRWKYDLLEANCNHFACIVRYGVSDSKQIDARIRLINDLFGIKFASKGR